MTDLFLPPASTPWKPHAYQKNIIKFMVGQGAAGIWADPGAGKTSCTLAAFKILKAKGLAKRMLIVAPLRPAYSVWPREIEKWAEFQGLTYSILHGPEKNVRVHDKSDIHIINYEGLSWLFGTYGKKGPTLRKTGNDPWPWDVLVIDEVSHLKNSSTNRFKTLRGYLRMFKRRYTLTGTPAPNGLMDVFSQVFVLDGGAALGSYITHYRNNYFTPSGYGGYDWKLIPGAEKQIYEKLRPLILRVNPDDYAALPPLIENEVEVRLPAAAMVKYKQMEEVLLTQVESEQIVAANAAAAMSKCLQIANGGVYHDGGEEWSDLHEAKVDAVEEIIEELGGKPVLVAFNYRHDLHRLLKRFGQGTPYLAGGVPASRFRAIEDAWNRGEIPILLAQPQSVAFGLNLQSTSAAIIWAGLTWDQGIREQFVRRIWRQGQKERVFVHYLIARDTVDEVVMAALKSKDKTQKALLNALSTYAKGRA